jgi:hypothetical protein
MKKVYVATPVNGRTEPTLEEKKEAALARCIEVRGHLERLHPDWVICYSFMVCPINQVLTEAEAMGRCVTLLMSCDMIVMDDSVLSTNKQSKGCKLEWWAADVYSIEKKFLKDIFVEPKEIVKL